MKAEWVSSSKLKSMLSKLLLFYNVAKSISLFLFNILRMQEIKPNVWLILAINNLLIIDNNMKCLTA